MIYVSIEIVGLIFLCMLGCIEVGSSLQRKRIFHSIYCSFSLYLYRFKPLFTHRSRVHFQEISLLTFTQDSQFRILRSFPSSFINNFWNYGKRRRYCYHFCIIHACLVAATRFSRAGSSNIVRYLLGDV